MAVFDPFLYLRQRPLGRLATKAFRLWRAAGTAGLCWRWRLLRAQTHGYARWLRLQSAREAAERVALAADIAVLQAPPLISVLMPVCDSPEPWLRQAINSVRGQLYPHWQLCIADDASTAAHVRPMLEAIATADARIHLTFRETRGHICLATSTALTLAEGEFVTFLDHDDELSPLALARVALEIAHHPEVDLLYSDEDLIGTDGRRYDPYFKPDWNPELLRAQNYLCHLSVYRADLLHKIDAFRPEVQGSQDWDLALRAAEQAKCIRHLPYILYHWRSLPGSTAYSDTAKHYALTAGQHAVQAHLRRCGELAEAELLDFGHLRVHHILREPLPRISLILSTPPSSDIGQRVESLLARTSYPVIEVLVTTTSSCELELPHGVRTICADHGESASQLLSRAAIEASGDILCFMDAAGKPTESGWLETMASLACLPLNGAVGARQLRSDATIWHAGYLLDPDSVVLHPYRGAPVGFAGLRNRALLQQNVSAVSFACFAVKKSLFEQLGGFDAASGPFFDVDFCLRLLELGLRNVWTPHATVIFPTQYTPPDHGEQDVAKNTLAMDYMQTCWHKQLANDPAGNRNLELKGSLLVPSTVST